MQKTTHNFVTVPDKYFHVDNGGFTFSYDPNNAGFTLHYSFFGYVAARVDINSMTKGDIRELASWLHRVADAMEENEG